MPSIAQAKTNTVVLSGTNWLGGNGVDVYSNDGDYGSDLNDNNYVNIGTADHPNNVMSGLRWQCVELINRLYLARGWTTARWAGNGYQMYDYAPSALSKEPAGSVTSVNAGDVIVFGGGDGNGHVLIVDSVTGTGNSRTVVTVSQNLIGSNPYRNLTWDVGNKTVSTWTGYSFTGIVHAPDTVTGSSGNPLDNGKFVSYHNSVYLIAGGAPLYVSGPDAQYLPDWTTAKPIDDGQWASLRAFPADGTFIADVRTGGVYVTVGGAPMYISGSDAPYLPNWVHALRVPHWDFDNWQHLRQYPADGYYLSDAQSGFVYNTAGGVPFYVSGQDAPALPQWQHATPIPHGELVNHLHFRTLPADGTYISDVQTGAVYITLGGAPMYISGADAPYLPNWVGATRVSHWEFQNWSYLRPYPADGYFLRDVQTGAIYVTVGGSPLYVTAEHTAWLPQWQYASPVPHWELQNWAHLQQLPVNGTYVRGVPSGEVFQMVGGAAARVTSNLPTALTNVDDWAIVNQLGGTL